MAKMPSAISTNKLSAFSNNSSPLIIETHGELISNEHRNDDYYIIFQPQEVPTCLHVNSPSMLDLNNHYTKFRR